MGTPRPSSVPRGHRCQRVHLHSRPPLLSPKSGATFAGMVDTLSPEERSRVMSRIRGKDTKPELTVRRILHSMGYRFRLHRRDLPGNPDIVLPRHGVCIFVHGCFWHLHRKCKAARLPKTRRAWWRKKLEGNVARDKRRAATLRRLGWRVITIWECQTEKPDRLLKRLQALLPHR